nr:MAG TPA: hypothetical protein [Caudoviricetes sp.]
MRTLACKVGAIIERSLLELYSIRVECARYSTCSHVQHTKGTPLAQVSNALKAEIRNVRRL